VHLDSPTISLGRKWETKEPEVWRRRPRHERPVACRDAMQNGWPPAVGVQSAHFARHSIGVVPDFEDGCANLADFEVRPDETGRHAGSLSYVSPSQICDSYRQLVTTRDLSASMTLAADENLGECVVRSNRHLWLAAVRKRAVRRSNSSREV